MKTINTQVKPRTKIKTLSKYQKRKIFKTKTDYLEKKTKARIYNKSTGDLKKNK